MFDRQGIIPSASADLGLRRSVAGAFAYIDGVSGVGKSTLLNGLKECSNSGICLPEYTDYARSLQLPIPSLSMPPDKVAETSSMWPVLDLVRAHELAKYVQAGEKQADFARLSYLDTSPVLTLAFEIARENSGYPSDVDGLLKEYATLISGETLDIFIPAHWIVLLGDSDTVQKRLLGRGQEAIHPFMFSSNVIEEIQSFILGFALTYVDPEFRTVINTTNLTADELLKTIKQAKSGVVGSRCGAFAQLIADQVRTRAQKPVPIPKFEDDSAGWLQ